MKKIRLAIIEDNHLLRDGLLSILKPQNDINIISTSGDDDDSLLKILKAKPDIILLDLGLRNLNSLRVVEIIKNELPKTKIVIMDLAPVQADILQFVKAGATGFILKNASIENFLETIRSVSTGKTILPEDLVDSLFTQIVQHAINGGTAKLSSAVKMTKREKEVIDLLADGLSNKQIAIKINISTYTVKSHIHNIMEKLALHTRLEIAKYSYSGDTLKSIAKSISTIYK